MDSYYVNDTGIRILQGDEAESMTARTQVISEPEEKCGETDTDLINDLPLATPLMFLLGTLALRPSIPPNKK